MMIISEVKEWLNTLPPSNSIAVDEGGLCLVEIGQDNKPTGSYCEIGGEPEIDEEPQ